MFARKVEDFIGKKGTAKTMAGNSYGNIIRPRGRHETIFSGRGGIQKKTDWQLGDIKYQGRQTAV